MHPTSGTLDAAKIALFLDVDGTLLPIRENPDDVMADGTLIATLRQCEARLDGALALVSGRAISEIDRIFAPEVFAAAGAHGAELRMHDGRTKRADDTPLPQGCLKPIMDFVARHEELLLEHKRGGVSLHYRRAPGLETACRNLAHLVLDDLGDAYRLIAGKMVFEIAPQAHSKGVAINEFLTTRPFAGRRPVFVGDDVTDEDGFRVVNELGGVSIRVGDIADSEARCMLATVEDVVPWLRHAILRSEAATHEGDPHS